GVTSDGRQLESSQTRASGRDSCHGHPVIVTAAGGNQLHQRVAQHVGERHRHVFLVRRGQSQANVFERQGRTKAGRLVFLRGNQPTIQLVGWRSEQCVGEDVEEGVSLHSM